MPVGLHLYNVCPLSISCCVYSCVPSGPRIDLIQAWEEGSGVCTADGVRCSRSCVVVAIFKV
jgi:hypothetical protein